MDYEKEHFIDAAVRRFEKFRMVIDSIAIVAGAIALSSIIIAVTTKNIQALTIVFAPSVLVFNIGVIMKFRKPFGVFFNEEYREYIKCREKEMHKHMGELMDCVGKFFGMETEAPKPLSEEDVKKEIDKLINGKD